MKGGSKRSENFRREEVPSAKNSSASSGKTDARNPLFLTASAISSRVSTSKFFFSSTLTPLASLFRFSLVLREKDAPERALTNPIGSKVPALRRTKEDSMNACLKMAGGICILS